MNWNRLRPSLPTAQLGLDTRQKSNIRFEQLEANVAATLLRKRVQPSLGQRVLLISYRLVECARQGEDVGLGIDKPLA